MKKKILIITLIICVATSAVYYKPLQVEAAFTSAGVSSAAASKVLLALLAMAGVVVEASDYEFIWEEGGLNTDALINNMIEYSRDLGMGMRSILSLGAAGATTLMFNRNLWNLFKGWARNRYGTDTSVSTQVGAINKDISVLPANTPVQVTYVWNNLLGTATITFQQDVICFQAATTTSNSVLPWRITYYFVPVEYNSTSTLYETYTITESGSAQLAGSGNYNISNEIGNGMYVAFGRDDSKTFSTFGIDNDKIDLGVNASGIKSTIAAYVSEYRNTGKLEITDYVEGKPVIGLDGESATTTGQDVVSYDTVATQEGSDVILEGPLAVSLPEAATLEVLLKQLAEDEITYEEYVAALGLAAVKTKDTTVESVREKEQAITVNPIAGTYTVSLNSLFPFCIPFDLYDIFSAFNAEPVAPEVTISLPVGYNGQTFTWEDYTLSLSPFDTVAQVARIFEYIIFCIGLMLLTRKLIEG